MKKNNSFTYTFQFGLIIIIMVTMITSLIVINLYSWISSEVSSYKKNRNTSVFIDTTRVIVYDTIQIIEKKPFDSPNIKITKTTPIKLKIMDTNETSTIIDTTKSK